MREVTRTLTAVLVDGRGEHHGLRVVGTEDAPNEGWMVTGPWFGPMVLQDVLEDGDSLVEVTDDPRPLLKHNHPKWHRLRRIGGRAADAARKVR